MCWDWEEKKFLVKLLIQTGLYVAQLSSGSLYCPHLQLMALKCSLPNDQTLILSAGKKKDVKLYNQKEKVHIVLQAILA